MDIAPAYIHGLKGKIVDGNRRNMTGSKTHADQDYPFTARLDLVLGPVLCNKNSQK